jgi:hypothetical protein
MQIPAFEDFRKGSGPTYGRSWHVDPTGADFTLVIPDADVLLEDDDAWQPHEASYRMALRVLENLDGLKQKAAEYLAGVVDAARHGMHGEVNFNNVLCDARAERVTVSMVWETNIYAEWTVTFAWLEHGDGRLREYRPVGMAFRNW